MTESSNIQSNSENLESNQPEDSGLKESVETHNDEIQKRNQIEDLKDKKICTYCGTGYRGNIAADELIKGGFNAVTLEGGYSTWV